MAQGTRSYFEFVTDRESMNRGAQHYLRGNARVLWQPRGWTGIEGVPSPRRKAPSDGWPCRRPQRLDDGELLKPTRASLVLLALSPQQSNNLADVLQYLSPCSEWL